MTTGLGSATPGLAAIGGSAAPAPAAARPAPALVVSVRNRTVVTAVDRQHMHEQVFTNIDSAVIA